MARVNVSHRDDACKRMDTIAQKLGSWDPDRVIREFRDSRYRVVRRPARRPKTKKAVDWDLLRKATAISWAYKVALYDAVYVALAERQGFPFLTADEVLLKKMKGHSIVLRLREMDFP